MSVKTKDVWRVYNTYIKGKPFVLTSFVPKGKPELAAANSQRFPIVEESVAEQKKASTTQAANDVKVDKIPSSFDRSVEPKPGPDPLLTLPQVWQDNLNNGLRVYGIEQRELPLVQFSLSMKGGLLLDRINKSWVAMAQIHAPPGCNAIEQRTPIRFI